MTLPTNIRVNIGAPFPARVTGVGPVTVSKSNGIWSIGVDFTKLVTAPVLNTTQELLIFDPVTGIYNVINVLSVAPPPIAPQNFTAGSGAGTFTPGTTTALTLSPTPSAAAAVDAYFNGVLQPNNSWTLAGAVLTFSAAIPVGTTLVTINQRH